MYTKLDKVSITSMSETRSGLQISGGPSVMNSNPGGSNSLSSCKIVRRR